ncbi:phosphonate metabolism transcriptional regulator PhnF [Bacillaceae bacterium]
MLQNKVQIDKESPIPIYYQLKNFIKEQIENGIWKPGDMIPSERELSEEFAISRMTVRQAFNELVNEGLLYRKRGMGTFVAKPKVDQKLSKLTNFTSDMLSRGMKPGAKVLALNTIPATKKIAEKLNLREGDHVVELFRLRLADEEPMALERSFLPYAKVSPILEEELENKSLYELLRNRCNLHLVRAKQTIEISYCNPQDAALLEIAPDTPSLLIERITFTEDGQPVEYVRSYYRADRYKFSIEMNV